MKSLNGLVALAIILIILWVIASVTKFVVGALIHLLLVAAIILLAIWAVRRIR